MNGALNADQVAPEPPSRLKIPSGIWALGFVSMFMDISSEMIHALLPVYLVTVLGTSTIAVGVFEGIAEATASITKVFSGALSDWLGRRKLLAAIGYGLAALTKPIFPLASSIHYLIAARFIDRVGKGIRGAPRDAMVADMAPAGLRGASFGLRQSLDTLGAIVGPLLAIGIMWLSADQFQTVFWFAVIPGFLSFVTIVFAVKEPKRPAQLRTVRMPLSRSELGMLGKGYWRIVVIGAVFTLARFSEAFLVLRAQSAGLPLALVPAVLVLMNLTYALSAYPAGVLSDRTNKTTILTISLLLLVGADLALALAANLALVGIGVALWGLHMGLSQGLLSTMVAESAPMELRGTAFGMFNLISGLALLAASVVAGVLWSVAGPAGTFLAGAAFAIGTLLLLLSMRTRGPESSPVDTRQNDVESVG